MAGPERSADSSPQDGPRAGAGVAVATPPADQDESVVHVRIDQDKCTGDGLCVTYAPDVFEFDIDGLAYVKTADGTLQTDPGSSVVVPEHLRIAVIDSADECPGDCIYVRSESGAVVAGPE
jgi:ferredoxin